MSQLNDATKQKIEEFGQAINFGDGDGFHDETVKLLEREKLEAQARHYRAQQIYSASKEIHPPHQFAYIEIGHKVQANLLDDPEVAHPCFITILPSANLAVLSFLFDYKENLLVSDESPLGKALLGKTVGSTVTYNSNRAIIERIGQSESVIWSSHLNLDRNEPSQ